MPFNRDPDLSGLSQQDRFARDGNLWVVNSDSPGTAIAYAALTAYSATANGFCVIYNGNAQGGASVYLKRIELFQTATVATGTTWSLEAFNETGEVTGTGSVEERTPIQVNSAKAQTTSVVVQMFDAGAITIPAAVGTRRQVAQGWIPVGVNVAKDVYAIDFGSDSLLPGSRGLTAARATDTGRLVGQMPSVIIPPQTTSWINLWGCGSSAPSFEYNLTYVEK